MRPAVVVTRRLPSVVEERLASLFEARFNETDAPLAESELVTALRDADAVLCTVSDRLPERALATSPRRARILANYGVGYDHIDIDAARRHGIVVTNTPGVLTDDTADLAMALVLMVARRLGAGERHLRAGEWTGWRPTHMVGARVSGKTLGVVGMGRIGRAVARRAVAGFGMRVSYHNRSPVPPGELEGAEPAGSLDELLATSDFVSLHVPATPATRHLIDAGTLRRMQPSAFLINTARGDIVHEPALIEALRAGTIAGAGLDVYEREPAVPDALLTMENVVLLPHLGSATLEARLAMGHLAVENLRAFFAGEAPPNRVV